jgi:hypothetical protein
MTRKTTSSRLIGLTFLVIVSAVSSEVSSAQTSSSAAEEEVRSAFADGQRGLYTSWDEKFCARLGDASSVELTKLLADKALSKQDIKAALRVIHMSYRAVALIEAPSNRQPGTTMFVLRLLALSTNDAEFERQIAATRTFVQDQCSSFTRQNSR